MITRVEKSDKQKWRHVSCNSLLCGWSIISPFPGRQHEHQQRTDFECSQQLEAELKSIEKLVCDHGPVHLELGPVSELLCCLCPWSPFLSWKSNSQDYLCWHFIVIPYQQYRKPHRLRCTIPRFQCCISLDVWLHQGRWAPHSYGKCNLNVIRFVSGFDLQKEYKVNHW